MIEPGAGRNGRAGAFTQVIRAPAPGREPLGCLESPDGGALVAYTFGGLLAWAALVAWIVSWAIGAVSVIRRGDLGVGGKALWLLVLVVLPLVGLLAYYLWQAANPDRSVAGSR